ncbi:MAG: lipocalin-like domain-containing protein [Vampirovibrionales bacterium]|nr:lipocalin-like domain-containing protein [Vampirovibrionales bacterium]
MKNKNNSVSVQKKPARPFALTLCILGLLGCLFLLANGVLFAQESPPVPQAPGQSNEPSATEAQKPSRVKRVFRSIKNALSPGEGNENSPPDFEPGLRGNPSQAAPAIQLQSDRLQTSTKTKSDTPAKKVLKKITIPITKEGFALAVPGYRYQFPRDWASHPRYKTEWWYYTGHLYTDDNKRYGYEVTFFRSGLPLKNPPTRSRWQVKDLYAAHFAITDPTKRQFVIAERLNRNSPFPGTGHALAESDRFYVNNDTWETWQIAPKKAMAQKPLVKSPPSFWLHAGMNENDHQKASRRYKLSLRLTPSKPAIIHGKNGVSQKADCKGCASHYYSYTNLATTGTLWVNGKPKKVTGISWMDREFGSNQLTKAQTGWDWFSVQLNNKSELMLYVLRNEKIVNGKVVQYLDPNSSGTLVFSNGKARHLKKSDFRIKALGHWTSPTTKAAYPMGWQVEVPAYKLDVMLRPVMEAQELVTHQSTRVAYWEGANSVTGTMGGKVVRGVGYVEMTGYAEQFRQRI